MPCRRGRSARVISFGGGLSSTFIECGRRRLPAPASDGAGCVRGVQSRSEPPRPPRLGPGLPIGCQSSPMFQRRGVRGTDVNGRQTGPDAADASGHLAAAVSWQHQLRRAVSGCRRAGLSHQVRMARPAVAASSKQSIQPRRQSQRFCSEISFRSGAADVVSQYTDMPTPGAARVGRRSGVGFHGGERFRGGRGSAESEASTDRPVGRRQASAAGPLVVAAAVSVSRGCDRPDRPPGASPPPRRPGRGRYPAQGHRADG